MAWENIQQVPSWLPQSYLSDAQSFMQALYSSGRTPQELLNEYVSEFNGAEPSNYVEDAIIAGDPNTNYKITGHTRQDTPTLYHIGTPDTSKYGQEFYVTDTDYLYSFIAIVNHDTVHGMIQVFKKHKQTGQIFTIGGNTLPFDILLQDLTYQILTANPYIQGNWKSWPSVTGKNGTFNFTMMRDEVIQTDTAITAAAASDFSRFSEQTDLRQLVRGLPYGVEQPIIYAGRVDYMSLTRIDEYSVTVKFYVNGSVIFSESYIYNDNRAEYLSFIVDEENEVARFSLVIAVIEAGLTRYNVEGYHDNADNASLYIWLHSHSPEPDVNDPEGDGDADPWNDIGISGLTEPTASGVATGFTSMYQVSDTQLKNLAAFLWSDNFFDNVTKFFNDPREILIGISLMPVEPSTGNAKNIKAGGVDTGIQGLPLTSQYKIQPMGSVVIKAEKTAKFLNYPPNTRIIAHLPYVGDHELNVHDIMGKTLTLTYLFDFLNGCCVAELAISGGEKTHRYFYSGSCAVQIPTSAEDFGRQYSAILSSGVAFGSALAAPFTGGLTAPMAIGALGNTLNNGMAMSPNVEYSSGGGAITGFLSSQTAYLVVELPNEKIADSQKNFIGRPSFMTKALSSVSGFAKCMDVHVKNIPCTGKEKDEIEANLKAGVLIEAGSPTPAVTPTVAGNTVLAFMNMKSENNVIGKTWDRGTDENAILKIEGKQIFDQSVLAPKFLISGNLMGFNYCYIALFGRFYYVTDIVAKSGNLMEVSLKCDPLQSFKTQILNCSAVIERAGSDSLINSYFNDGMYWTQANKTVKFIPFLSSTNEELTLPRNANSYILTIAGGD